MEKENFEDLSPFLKDLKRKGEDQRVPAHYFDGLEDAVFAQIKNKGLDRQTVTPAMKASQGGRFNRIWLVAAAVVLLVSAVWFLRFSNNSQSLAPYAQIELTEEEVETYLLDHVHDFELEALSAIGADLEDLDMPNKKSGNNHRKSDDLTPEDIESVIDQMSDEELEDLL